MKSSIVMLLSALVLFSGCGKPEGRKSVYPVSGKVTMSGGPLADAVVTFAPKEGQPVAYGRTNSSGEYSLTTYESNDGAAEGNFTVTVSKFLASAPASSGDDGHSTDPNASFDAGHVAGNKKNAEASSNLVPPDYSDSMKSPLSYKVEAKSDNRFDIEIK